MATTRARSGSRSMRAGRFRPLFAVRRTWWSASSTWGRTVCRTMRRCTCGMAGCCSATQVYLPTYGMFDEGRFFGRGARVEAYEPGGGWRAAVLICEDFWHPALMYLAAIQGCTCS